MAHAMVIPTYFTAVDMFSKPLQQMKAGLLTFGRNLTNAEAVQATMLKNKAYAAQEAAMTFGGAAVVLGAPLALAGRQFMEFQDQMASVATLIDPATESLKEYSDAVRKIALTSPKEMSDITKAMYDIRSVGYQGAEAMDMLQTSSYLATAGLSTATEAANGITAAVKNFSKQGLDATMAANGFMVAIKEGKTTMPQLQESFGNVAGVMAAANIQFTEFLGLTAALTNTGVPASEAMNGIAGAVIAMNKQSGEMSTVFDALGYSGANAAQDLIKAKGGLLPALTAIAKEAAVLDINLNKVFGRREPSITVGKLTSTIHDSAQNIIGDLQSGQTPLMDALAAKTQTAAYQFALLSNNVRDLAIGIGEKLEPVMVGFAGILNGTVSVLRFFFDGLGFVSTALTSSLGILTAILGTLAAFKLAVWASVKAMELFKWGMYGIRTATLAVNLALNVATDSVLGFEIAMGGILAITGLLIAAASAYGKKQEYLAQASTNFSDSLKVVNGELRQEVKLLNQAEINQQRYQEATNNWAKSQNAYLKATSDYNALPWHERAGEALLHSITGIDLSGGALSPRPSMSAPKMEDYMTSDEINSLSKPEKGKSKEIHVHTSFESHDKTSAGVSFKNVNSYIMPTDSGTKPKM
jgi:TP901 family phage tail tape measure protein